jgi:hypothetical protein
MECWSVGKSDTRASSAGNENLDQRDSLMYGPLEHWTVTPLLQYSNTPTNLGFLTAQPTFPDLAVRARVSTMDYKHKIRKLKIFCSFFLVRASKKRETSSLVPNSGVLKN